MRNRKFFTECSNCTKPLPFVDTRPQLCKECAKVTGK